MINPATPNQINPHPDRSEQEIFRTKVLLFTLAIITMIGGLVCTGSGLAGFGDLQGWWFEPVFSHMGQFSSLLNMGLGGGIALISIISCFFIPRYLKHRFEQSPHEPSVEPSPNPIIPKASTRSIPNADPLEQMRRGLQAWVMQAPAGERDRCDAADKILECFQNKGVRLELNFKLTTLPPEIGLLAQLIVLDLDGNRLSNLPQEIGQLNRLEELSLSGNRSTVFPHQICQLRQLKILRLSFNHFTSLPSDIDLLTELEELDLSDNELTDIPPQIYQLTQLKTLALARNQLTSLPEEINQLRQLEILDLARNSLRSVPPKIFRFTQLKTLNLSYNQFTSVPPGIVLPAQLVGLELGGNRLTEFPPQICRLAHLKTLNLSYNQFTSVPPGIVLPAQLVELKLGGNRLAEFPPQICRLAHLKTLNLSQNWLASLPSDIDLLAELEELNLANNRLTDLPPPIFRLAQLKHLSLFHNRLTSLPSEISLLNQLTDLSLCFNQLTSLPEEIIRLPDTAVIGIERNPLSLHVIRRLQEVTSADGYRGPFIHFSIDEERSTDERPLKELLQELSKAAGKEPITLTRLLPHTESVKIWLSRLSAIGDYKNKRQELAQLIYNSIVKANAEDDFRDTFLGCIQGAAETCGDRMTLSVLYLGIQYEIAKALKAHDLGKLAYLLGHGTWALSQLEEIAKNKVSSLRFVDEIEVYLAYPVMLKERLQLPIVIDTMLYFGCSSVTEQDLDFAAELVHASLSNLDSYCEQLAKSPQWEKALESRGDYAALLNRRNAAPDPLLAQKQYEVELKTLTQVLLQQEGLPPFLAAERG